MDIIVLLRSLFCALAVTLPGALGRTTWLSDHKPPKAAKVLINRNTQPPINTVDDLQSVFTDINCMNCTSCINRAIQNLTKKQTIVRQDTHNDMRSIRSTSYDPNTFVKGRTVTALVTKYTKDKKVMAIEIKEAGKNTCKVYSAKKSMPCDSPCDSICALNKKLNKKVKKAADAVNVTIAAQKSITPVYKKREAEYVQVSDSFMPSIEELY